MTEHVGLPEPFLDRDGFPLPLRHVRDEVVARGGTMSGRERHWVISHPDPALPDITVTIYPDGDVLIDAGDDLRLDVFCTTAWLAGPAEHPWSHVEDVLTGILAGGFERTVWRGRDGEIVNWTVSLTGPWVDEAGGNPPAAEPVDATRRTVTYPAWPPSTMHESHGE